MPNTERLIVKLELDAASDAPSTLDLIKVKIQRATRRTDGADIPYQPADVEGAPAADEKVYLQIWECDTFEGARGGTQSTNEFLVEIPGYVKQDAAGGSTYHFRVLEAPTMGTGDSAGWFKLKLKDSAGADWLDPSTRRPLLVPIRGEAEVMVDLGVSIETAAGARTKESAPWKNDSCLHLTNLTHIIGSMLTEGGLCLSFHVDNNSPAEKEWRRKCKELNPGVPLETRMDYHCGHSAGNPTTTGKTLRKIINDDEFVVQGEVFKEKYHSLGLSPGGNLKWMSNPFDGQNMILQPLAAIRQKVHEKFLEGQGEPPKVKRLAILTHGGNHGMLIGPNDRWFNMTTGKAFFQQVAPHCTDDVVLPLFACCTASNGASDADFGHEPRAGKRLGEGCYAEMCCQTLKEGGCTHACVWGHTTAAHTTKNGNLRAFIASPSAEFPAGGDVIWMVRERPAGRVDSTISSFMTKARANGEEIMHLSILHAGTEISRCSGGACSA